METVKRKRGRPRKNKLPEEIQQLVQEVQSKQETVQQPEEVKVSSDKVEWDVPLDQEVEYFDSS